MRLYANSLEVLEMLHTPPRLRLIAVESRVRNNPSVLFLALLRENAQQMSRPFQRANLCRESAFRLAGLAAAWSTSLHRRATKPESMANTSAHDH